MAARAAYSPGTATPHTTGAALRWRLVDRSSALTFHRKEHEDRCRQPSRSPLCLLLVRRLRPARLARCAPPPPPLPRCPVGFHADGTTLSRSSVIDSAVAPQQWRRVPQVTRSEGLAVVTRSTATTVCSVGGITCCDAALSCADRGEGRACAPRRAQGQHDGGVSRLGAVASRLIDLL